ncbi:MAG: M23 family metallopeptidase [Saccharothrix sp.]|nr:M23 family metallopeptidase [Saccharothrix sp.]
MRKLSTVLVGLALAVGVVSAAAPAQAADGPSTTAAPVFQMPFFCHQTWVASTYDGHSPDQNSIDLMRVNAATSEGLPVVASADGTVSAIGEVEDDLGQNFGEYVYINHGNGYETRYLHIETGLAVGTSVVRGQHLGTIGKYLTMTPHLHYTQLLNGVTLRIAFSNTLINVHKNAPKDANGNYPTQNLTSNNCPADCVLSAFGINGGAVKCASGAGVRVAIECEMGNGTLYVKRGSFVAAKTSSTAICGGGHLLLDRWFEVS